MTNFHLVIREIRFRRLNFVLSAAAVTFAGMLLVAGPTIVDGYRRHTSAEIAAAQAETEAKLAEVDKKTRRTMRDLGFNLRILHKDTNLSDFYGDFRAVPMPEEYIHRLAEESSITTIVHLVATLWEKTKWNDRTVLVIGMLPEVAQSHIEQKAPMGYNIVPGTCLLGHELGIGHEEGEAIDILGHEFTIARILPEEGTYKDIMLGLELHDAQAVLDMPDQITQILALGCKCAGDRISKIRDQLSAVMPEVQIHEDTGLADAREKQRDLVTQQGAQILADIEENRGQMERSMAMLVNVTTPLVVVVAAALVGLLAWLNVRERLTEIGLLRAVGRRTGNIAGLFLGKAVLLGLLGGALGCGLGYLLAWQVGQRMGITVAEFQVDRLLLLATLLGAPVVAAMASYLPMLHAVQQDPASVLLEH